MCVGALVYEYEVKTGDRRKEREKEERERGERERGGKERKRERRRMKKAVQASINSQQSLQVQKKHNRNHMTIT